MINTQKGGVKLLVLVIVFATAIAAVYFGYIKEPKSEAKSKVFLDGMKKEIARVYKNRNLKMSSTKETSKVIDFPGEANGPLVQKTLSGHLFSYQDPELLNFSKFSNYLSVAIGPTPPWLPQDSSRDVYYNKFMICTHQYAVYLDGTSHRDPKLPDNPEIFCAVLPQ